MAFVTEDGTGLENANSYGSVEGADAYFAERGITWTGTQADKEHALVLATDYIDARFALSFQGQQAYPTTQALCFPRTAFDGLPAALLKATYEYARRARAGELAPDPSNTTGVAVKRERKKVGPLEKETEYATASQGTTATPLFKPYPIADAWIAKLLRPTNRVHR